MTASDERGRHESRASGPEDPDKPDSPSDLTKRSWRYVLRRTFREFLDDQCTDLAAALTFFSVLGIFPAALALTSILGLVDQRERAVETVVDVMDPLVSSQTLGTIRPVLEDLASSDSAGLTLVFGLLLALWSASAYVAAFARAMNSIYEVPEGRPFWKLRPLMILVTLAAVVLMALVLLMLIVSGPLAKSIGGVIGLGDAALTAWSIAKWPVLAVVVMLIVAMLYWATPNVQQPKFRWLSLGAAVAIVVWAIASVGFAFYVGNFSNYNRTYGSLAGVVVTLLFLWITNLALLLGAELDSELERGRQLQAGIPAESELQLPPRDTSKIEKDREKERKDAELGRRIRLHHAGDPDTDDRDTDHHDRTAHHHHREDPR